VKETCSFSIFWPRKVERREEAAFSEDDVVYEEKEDLALSLTNKVHGFGSIFLKEERE